MDIASLLHSLSDEDVRRLQETAASIFGTEKGGTAEHKQTQSDNALPIPNGDMLAAAAKMSELFSARDERSELIYALKPFLGEQRRQKADQAAMMLKMLKIVDLVRGREQ